MPKKGFFPDPSRGSPSFPPCFVPKFITYSEALGVVDRISETSTDEDAAILILVFQFLKVVFSFAF